MKRKILNVENTDFESTRQSLKKKEEKLRFQLIFGPGFLVLVSGIDFWFRVLIVSVFLFTFYTSTALLQ